MTSANTAALLIANKISYERFYRSVFGTVSLRLDAGNCLLLTGVNGAGKTTLLKVLAGVLRPTHGTVERADQHFVGHQLGLHRELTVQENLRQYLSLWSPKLQASEQQTLPANDCIEQALNSLQSLPLATQRVGSLSAGQAKRAALARLLLVPRRLWLLDEPFVNLDQASIDLLLQQIRQHCAQGGSAVIASHALGLADLPGSQRLKLPVIRPELHSDKNRKKDKIKGHPA